MRSFIWVMFLFIVVLIGQTTLASVIQIFGVGPDFVLIFVVFVALRYGAAAGVLWGFMAGLVEDVYGPLEFVGAATLSKCIVGWLVGQMEEKFLNLDIVTKVAILGVSFFLCDAIYVMSVGMVREEVARLFLQRSLPEGVYTLLIGTIAFHFLYPRSGRRNAS